MKSRMSSYRVLLAIVMGILFLPMIQDLSEFIKFTPLKGAIVEVKKEDWSLDSWFSGAFQKNREDFIQSNFGFRTLLIRINNQFNYSFWGKASSPNYFIGRDHYLFSEEVVSTYKGTGAIAEDSIRYKLEQFKFVQDTLKKLNKHLVFMVAPGKASIYSDKIPDFRLKGKTTNNYEVFIKHAKALNINYVDYSDYFKQLRKESTIPLFPEQGVHWSIYSTSYVIDSLMRYLDFQTKSKLTTYTWSKEELLEPQGTDLDVGDVFNLLFDMESSKLPYRTWSIQKRNNDSLKVLTVGDSFYRELFNNGLKEILPANNEFWFYGRVSKSHDGNMENDMHVSRLDFKKKVSDADVIIIFYYEGNLGTVGYRMIERLYRLYTKQSLMLKMDYDFNKYVLERIRDFKKDEAMMKKIQEKALSRKVSLDSMLKSEAAMAVEYDIWYGNITLQR